jgi:hypothetical protein
MSKQTVTFVYHDEHFEPSPASPELPGGGLVPSVLYPWVVLSFRLPGSDDTGWIIFGMEDGQTEPRLLETAAFFQALAATLARQARGDFDGKPH